MLRASHTNVKLAQSFANYVLAIALTDTVLHSAECFEDYEKSTGMNQWQGLTDEEINSVRHNRDWTAHWTDATFARAIEAKLKEKNT